MNLEQLRKLYDDAAPGPWTRYKNRVYVRGGPPGQVSVCEVRHSRTEDLDLIVAAQAALPGLIDVAFFCPRYCICHVKSFDGYYGGTHSEACAAYLGALKRAGIEVER